MGQLSKPSLRILNYGVADFQKKVVGRLEDIYLRYKDLLIAPHR